MVDEADTPDRAQRLSDLAALYREHHDYVARVLRHVGLDPAWVDDALQDVFLVVYRRLDAFDAGRSIRNWLYGIARRVASDYRRGTRRGSRPLVLVADPTTFTPARSGGDMELARLVQQFVDTLEPRKRRVFVLAEVEGMTAPEIAEVEGLNVNTVYARLRAARLAFEKLMDEHGGAAKERAPWTG